MLQYPTNEHSTDLWSSVDSDILHHILNYINSYDTYCALSQVCRSWNRMLSGFPDQNSQQTLLKNSITFYGKDIQAYPVPRAIFLHAVLDKPMFLCSLRDLRIEYCSLPNLSFLNKLQGLKKLCLKDVKLEMTLQESSHQLGKVLLSMPELTHLTLSSLLAVVVTSVGGEHRLEPYGYVQIPSQVATLTRLVSLELSHGNMTEFPDFLQRPDPAITQDSFIHLKHLSFSYNLIQEVPSWTLNSFPNLESLDLSSNKLIRIDENLTPLPFLRKLDISGNPSALSQASSIINQLRRSRLPALETINLRDVPQVSQFFRLAFARQDQCFASLKQICLSSCRLFNIPIELKKSSNVMALDQLQILDLSHNEISTLPQWIESDWENLLHLDIRHNKIHNVQVSMAWMKRIPNFQFFGNSGMMSLYRKAII